MKVPEVKQLATTQAEAGEVTGAVVRVDRASSRVGRWDSATECYLAPHRCRWSWARL